MAAKSKKREAVGIWIVFLVMFVVELLFYTWCQVQNRRIGYEIAVETKRNARILADQNNLKLELAHLKSPQRIAQIAVRDLGLIMPDAKQTMVIP